MCGNRVLNYQQQTFFKGDFKKFFGDFYLHQK